jgi:hypothetical protein
MPAIMERMNRFIIIYLGVLLFLRNKINPGYALQAGGKLSITGLNATNMYYYPALFFFFFEAALGSASA